MNNVQGLFPVFDPTPSSRSGRPQRGGSGLIDLSDLRDQPKVVADHLAIFPLGAPPSVRPAPAVHAAPAQAGRKPVGALVVAVAIAAAGIGVAAGMLFKAEARGPVARAGVATVAQELPARMPAPPAPPEPPSQQAAEPPSPPPVVEVKTPATPAPIQRTVTPRRPVVAATPKPPPPRPAAPPADPCKGDLMCAMQRAVKK